MSKLLQYTFACLLSIGAILWSLTTAAQSVVLKIKNFRGAVQWEQSADKINWSAVAGGITADLEQKPVQTTYYRAKVTEQNCDPIYSDLKAIFVHENLVIGAKVITGKVNLPIGSTVKLDELQVSSMLEETRLKADSTFEVLALDSTSENQLFLSNKDGDVIMIGHYVGETESYNISAESTAMALLLMYPFLRPITSTEKEVLITKYKAETEFSSLVRLIIELNKTDQKLFSNSNEAIRGHIEKLVSKDFNEKRLQKIKYSPEVSSLNQVSGIKGISESLGSTGNLAGDLVIDIKGTKLIITNTQNFSYVGTIYNAKDGKELASRFNVAGTLLSGSEFLKNARPEEYKLSKDDLSSTREFDLKVLGGTSGEYRLRLRSGLAFDNTEENSLALGENTFELTMFILDNITPNIKKIKEKDNEKFSKCTIAIVNNIATQTKLHTVTPTTNLLEEVYIPFFTDQISTLTECNSAYLPPALSSFLKKAVKVVDFWNKVKATYTMIKFIPDWALSPKKIDGCNYLFEDDKLTNCFIIESGVKLKEKYYTGDSVKIEINLVGNKNFYPYTDDYVGMKIKFAWIASKGGGEIGNRGQFLYPDSTNSGGFASTFWFMPCEETLNEAGIRITGLNLEDPLDLFKTNSYNPKLKAVHTGNNQKGDLNKKLDKNLSIGVRDELENFLGFLPMDRFKIIWQIEDGSGTVKPVYSPSGADSSYSWTLGNKTGKQTAKAIIKAKNECLVGWKIPESPIIFFANDDSTEYYRSLVPGNWTSIWNVSGDGSFHQEDKFVLYKDGTGLKISQRLHNGQVSDFSLPEFKDPYPYKHLSWRILAKDGAYYFEFWDHLWGQRTGGRITPDLKIDFNSGYFSGYHKKD